jgi:hypothetical protein
MTDDFTKGKQDLGSSELALAIAEGQDGALALLVATL